MKKITLLLFVITATFAKGQDFYQALGGQMLYGSYTYAFTSDIIDYGPTTDYTVVPGIVYKASIAYDAGNNYFAISSYPFLGFSLNSREGGSAAFELPILAEYYFGDLDDINFFFGAGWTYAGVSGGGSVTGPQFGIGGQFELNGMLFGIRTSYTHGINKTKDIPEGTVYSVDKRSMFNFGLYYMLGY